MADDLFQRTPHAPSGGGMSDMLSAFKSFGESIDQLGAQRAISQANQNVDLIRNSELDDAKKQQAMQDNARLLAGHLTGFGGSASGTQQLYNAFAPAKPSMPQNDVEAAYQFRNDPKALKQYTDARKQILDVTDPVEEDSGQSLAEDKFDNEKTQQNIRNLEDVRKVTNEAEAKGRNPFGKLAIKRDQVNDLRGLLAKDPSKYKDMVDFQVKELVTGLNGVFTGGIPTDTGTAGLMPEFLQKNVRLLQQYATGKPVGLDADGFIKLYQDTIDRTNSIVDAQILAYKKQTMRAIPAIARKAGIDDFNELAHSITGETATLENGHIKFSGDKDEDNVKNALGALFKHPDDPAAKGILQNIESDSAFWGTMFNPANKAMVNQFRSYKNRLYK